ncbi:hypothetical protein Mterra_00097 [Calidithermus terrae]|uniref:DUF3987 domain-containing protein n=1 Tax=Calidithermus terrae TaxID=1408545 RepID=A0A399F457_9DEIN|nr:YfjI family protein [Calidithermus terrae]RIH90873.1 hypothetical protein Mterra_00097 [Calidithermus terrae]
MSALDALKAAPEVQATEVWPEPEPLESLGEAPLREFPRGAILPPELEDYALAFADRLRVPLGVVAMAQLCAASAVVGGRAFVAPDVDNPGWRESSALWVAGVMDVSTKKTPILNAALRPLHEIEAELREDNRRALEAYEAELDAWAGQKRGERGPKPQKPPQARLLASDCTREALADLLTQNPGLLAFQDELAGLFREWRREDRGSERAFYLAAYSGSPVNVDRVVRGSSYIERPVLTLLGFVQPGPFREMVREALEEGSGADGLLQRFVLVTGEPLEWVEERPPVPLALAVRYANTLKGLYNLVRAWPAPRTLAFDAEAQALWYRWESQTERAIRHPDHSTAWRAYLGKRLGLTARLALVLGLLRGEYERLSVTTLKRAIALVLWLEPHARRVWARALTGDTGPVLKLARKLQAGEPEGFTLRELYRRGVAGIATAAEARRVVEALAEAGWVLPDPQDRHRYRVNPRVREVSRVRP